MTNRMTFYCEADGIYTLTERYGDHLQDLDLRSKVFLRAALSTYQLRCHLAEMHDRQPNPTRTIHDCIESVDSDSWEELESLTDWLIAFVEEQERFQTQHEFEGVIKGLSDAIACHTDYDE